VEDITKQIAQYTRKVTAQFTGTPTEPYIPEMISRFAAQIEALYPKLQATENVLNNLSVVGILRPAYYNFARMEYALIRAGLAGGGLKDRLNAEKVRLVSQGLTAGYMEAISLTVFGVPLV